MTEEKPKQDYFQYFRGCRGTGSRKNKLKLLPHIVEQYNYRITNHLLLKKIISPKRDKIIMHSLEYLQKKPHTPGRQRSLHSRIPHRRNHSSQQLSRNRPTPSRTVRHHQTEHLKNTASTHFSGPYHKTVSFQREYIDQNTQNSKERWQFREGVSMSHHLIAQHNQQQFKGFLAQHNSTYGKGPTILHITSLQIYSNPALKLDTLVQLELIEKPAFVKKIRDVELQREEQVIKSNPIPYANIISVKSVKCPNLKFCLKVTKIGDFIPLRIWKYSGVQSYQLGTVDLSLNPDRDSTDSHVSWQQGVSGAYRRVLLGEIKGKLRKGKGQTQTEVQIHYRIYPKRFIRPRGVECVYES